jgi:hypothetical protein
MGRNWTPCAIFNVFRSHVSSVADKISYQEGQFFIELECSLTGYSRFYVTYTHGGQTKYYPDCIYGNTVTVICHIMVKDSSMGNHMYRVNCKKQHMFFFYSVLFWIYQIKIQMSIDSIFFVEFLTYHTFFIDIET